MNDTDLFILLPFISLVHILRLFAVPVAVTCQLGVYTNQPTMADPVQSRVLCGEMQDLPLMNSQIVRIFTSSTFTGNTSIIVFKI